MLLCFFRYDNSDTASRKYFYSVIHFSTISCLSIHGEGWGSRTSLLLYRHRGEFEVLYYHTQTHSICSLGQHLPAQVGKQEGMHETEHMAKVRQTAL